jgi:fluoride ion exporter CrcB/FEX
MNLVWYVAVSGAVGARRGSLSSFIQQRAGTFPVGTLIVNITGSLSSDSSCGMRLARRRCRPRRAPTAGFCGGYTILDVQLRDDRAHGRR